MQPLGWKSRIALLWVAVAVLTPLRMLLVLTEVGAIDGLRAGNVEGMHVNGPSTVMWVPFVLLPLVMAVLTLVLTDRAARWANGLLGAIVAALLVAWHAVRWPVQLRVEAEPEQVGAP